MDELRVLLEQNRDATGSPVDSIIEILNNLHLQDSSSLGITDHGQLFDLVNGYAGEALEEVHLAYLRFLIKFANDSMDINADLIDLILQNLVGLGERHPSSVTGKREFFEALLTYIKLALTSSIPHSIVLRIVNIVLSVFAHDLHGNSVGLTAIAVLNFLCISDQGKPFNYFLRLLKPNEALAKHPVLLSAGLNCLGNILRVRPKCLPRGLPTFLEWYDIAPRFEGFSAAQKRNIEHSIKNQLSSLLNVAEASTFLPLISESLGKRKQQNNYQPVNARPTTTSNKRTEVPVVPQDEPDEKYAKRLKPSAAFADESTAAQQVKLDIFKIPFPAIMSSLLKTCRKLEPSMVRAKLEAWRPSAGASEAPIASSSSEDPRKRGGGVKTEVKAYKEDPEIFTFESFQPFLSANFTRVLDAALRQGVNIKSFGDGRRKEWAFLVARYAVILDDPLIESKLFDYCFQDLSVRSGLMMLWLRFKWMRIEGELTGEEHAKFEQAFIRLLGRMEYLMELDSTSADLEECLGDVLVYSPGTGLESSICMFFMRGLGLADTPEVEEGEEMPDPDIYKRALIFRLIKRLLIERQGYRHALATLIEEILLSTDSEIRTEIYKVCAATLSLSPLGELYKELAIQRILKEPTVPFGLYFELLNTDLSLLKSLVPIWDGLPEDHKALVTTKLTFIFQHAYQKEPSSLDALLELVADAPSCFVQIVVQALPSSAPTLSGFFEIILRRLDAKTLDYAVITSIPSKSLDKEMLIRFLPHFVLHLLEDPSSSEGKSELSALFQEIIKSPTGPSPQDIFVTLHRLESTLSLKRCIEACNICFSQPSIWKPEVLLASLEVLLDDKPLPTSYMRSVIQALTLHPKALGPGIQSLLSKLIPHKVWENSRLWEGWLRACKLLLPASLPLLLHLPVQHLQVTLEAIPEAQAPFKEYLWQQPPSLRNRFSSVLSFFDHGKT